MDKKTPDIRFIGFTDDWKQRKLGELGSVEMNRRIFKDQTSEYGDIPFYKIGTFGKIPDSFITRQLFKEYKSKYPYPNIGDLLLSASGSIGKIVEYTGADEYFQDSNIVWLKHDNNLANSFLKQFYTFVKWQGLEGSTIKRLYNKNILSTKINLPTINEQEIIGDFFLKFDQTITLHQQKLDKLLLLKKAYLQQLFPENGQNVPNIRFANFTDDWEQRKLGEHAIIKGRLGWKSLKQEEYTEKGPSMIAGRHIKNGTIIWGMVDHIPKWRYEESPEIMLKNGDVIFSKDGSLGNPVLISNLQTRATINSTMMLVRTDNCINSNYFFQVMTGQLFKKLIYLKVSGSSIPHLFQADMNTFEFSSPHIQEQEKIAKILDIVDKTIIFHQNKLEKLTKLKKAYLQKLFV